jgi:general secretion pathway protein K
MVKAMKTRSSISSPERSRQNGFVIIAVLWILGAISALVSIYTVYVINTTGGFTVHDRRLRAEALVKAAIELMAYRHFAAQTQPRPTRGQFSFQLGQADVAVKFQAEAARIDLNAAPKQMLTGLFLALGDNRERAETYSDRIIAWRTAPTNTRDSEELAYRAAGLDYQPRRAKFPHESELSLVRGLPSSVVERMLPFVTVYSGRPQINILDAAPEVIAALPGMTPDRLAAVLKQRMILAGNGEVLGALLGTAQQWSTTDGGNTFRVTVSITFDGSHSATSEAIILIFETGNQPYAILSWRYENTESRAGNLRWAGLR